MLIYARLLSAMVSHCRSASGYRGLDAQVRALGREEGRLIAGEEDSLVPWSADVSP